MTISVDSPSRVQVTAFGRLHFGLVNLSASGGRANGGAGIMVRQSSIRVTLEMFGRPAQASDVLGPELHLLAERLGVPAAVRATVDAGPLMKWHYGMGYHTQLRLSLATALAVLNEVKISPRQLTEVVMRGGTSGIGVHGFWQGGVLFDGGRRRMRDYETLKPSSSITTPASSPLLFARKSFPFTMVVVQAKGWALIHGEQERELFARLTPLPLAEANQTARLVFQDLMSSVAAADFDAFCCAMDEVQTCGFKQRELRFRGRSAVAVARTLADAGLRGVGMSSWGPTWFGFAKNRDAAARALSMLGSCDLLESACIAEVAPSAQVQIDGWPAIGASAAIGNDPESLLAGDA